MTMLLLMIFYYLPATKTCKLYFADYSDIIIIIISIIMNMMKTLIMITSNLYSPIYMIKFLGLP